MKEIWKDIEGFEGYYQISNLGRVRSLDRTIQRSDGICQFRKGIIKTPKNSVDGYDLISMNKNNMQKTCGIHILVAKHFIPNPNNLPEVNHKDFNRKNNRVDNLEWCTHQDNISYSASQGRYKIRDFNGKNNPNYGNHVLAEYYKNNPEVAKEKLSRPESQNGRATKIKLMDLNKKVIEVFDWIGGCAKYLIDNGYTKSNNINGIRDRIGTSMRKNEPYLGFYYEKM